MLPLLTLRTLTVDQEQSCKEISYQAAVINTIRTLNVQSSEKYETPILLYSMCLDSLNGWKSLASAMLNKELKPRVPTANSQICSRDLFPKLGDIFRTLASRYSF